jgi:hypothetical protein
MKTANTFLARRIKKPPSTRWKTVTVHAHGHDTVQVDDGKELVWVRYEDIHPDDLDTAIFAPVAGDVVIAVGDYGCGPDQWYLVLDRTGDQLTARLLRLDETGKWVETDKTCEMPAYAAGIDLQSDETELFDDTDVEPMA